MIFVIPYILFIAMIGNASYLSYKYINFYYLGGFMSADCGDDCDSVMTSAYGLIFNIPTPVFGVLAFLTLLVLFILAHLKQSEKARKLFELALIVTCIGAAVFLYILYFKLEMFCKFCMLSHALTYALAIYYFWLKPIK